uniref:Uncharacterized protein n=1 Tax=Anguilla anguilla TaxID=7936 RepID=A0A0E9RE69_ANGAN
MGTSLSEHLLSVSLKPCQLDMPNGER